MPVATTLKVAVLFESMVTFAGCVVIANPVTVNVAAFDVAVFPLPSVTIQRNCLPFKDLLAAKLSVAVLQPDRLVLIQSAVDDVLVCHWYAKSVPTAAIVNFAVLPASTVTFFGCVVIPISVTVSFAALEVTVAPLPFVTITRNCLPFKDIFAVKLSVAVLQPDRLVLIHDAVEEVLVCH